ncbi:MAG: type II toxin-antitoxin system VapC family toxin [Candidatus Nezhaarchaeales archaeon]|nr:MAG: DNA-binding protein [Candidatus Nezhaarchaeota archaeon WYZ-LMO8]
MYLFDASAIMNLVKRGRFKAFAKGATLDLAAYETINAVWKECLLLKRVRVETAYKWVKLLSKVFSVLELKNIRGLEEEVFNLAVREGVTVYDASYLYIAMTDKLTLVTDDSKLIDIARKHVSTISTSELPT